MIVFCEQSNRVSSIGHWNSILSIHSQKNAREFLNFIFVVRLIIITTTSSAALHGMAYPNNMMYGQDNPTASASPIERADDASTFELNVTQLSLPDSFDESLCLDLYNDIRVKSQTPSPSGRQSNTTGGDNDDANASFADHNLEVKVRQLMAANLELKEKCCRYDQAQRPSTNYESTIDGLRSQLTQQTVLHDIISKREKELQHQILDQKRKIQVLNLDLESARNETVAFSQRAEKAEHDSETNVSSLRSLQHKYDVAISRHATEHEDIKQEISRIREECKKEIEASRTHQNEAFTRESMLLRDARDHAIDQAKTLQQDLSDLRHERESKEAEYLDINKELERQLSDARSELKVKVYEFNTLRACQDRAVAESNRIKKENKETKTALAQLRNEYANLQRRTDIERTKSEEIIRQKCELLDIYQHEDLLIEDGDECGETSDAGHTLTGRKSLLKNSIALASKCRKLQSALKQSGDALAIEQEKNQHLTKKNQSNQRLFNELAAQTKKTTSSCMVSAIKTKDKEIFELSSKMNMLQLELSKTKQERDDCTSRLTELVRRRNQAKEMKALVESMRSTIVAPVNCPHCKTKQEPMDDDEEDMLDHVVHRGVSNFG